MMRMDLTGAVAGVVLLALTGAAYAESLAPEALEKLPLGGLEGQPYWCAFVRLAALEEDPRLLALARNWVDKLVAGADADGWFGPQSKKASEQGGHTVSDIWGHMLMCDALWAWYEYSHDERIVALLVNFFGFCNVLPDDRLQPAPFKGLERNWSDDVAREPTEEYVVLI